MITFVPKPNVPSVLDEIEENRFERIRNEAAERHRKAATDSKRRRDRQKVEDMSG